MPSSSSPSVTSKKSQILNELEIPRDKIYESGSEVRLQYHKIKDKILIEETANT